MKFFIFALALVASLISTAQAEDMSASDAMSSAPALPSADPEEKPSWYSLHAQSTFTEQGHPGFSSSIGNGPNSMKARTQIDETVDATLFMGVKLGGLEIYADPEMDQGYGLSSTLGVAGFPNGEGSKVGEHEPYFRMQRLFGRYVYGLSDDLQPVEDGVNQVASNYATDNITFTFGKFSVVDIFDTNSYAHDPRSDFLNWSMIDMGAFDYAADAWGYTYGGAVEWNQSWWTLRSGLFDMSRVPNDKYLTRGFGEYQIVTEAEERHKLLGQDGKVKALFFLSAADMGSYDDALTLSAQNGMAPDTALVRHWQTKPGGGLNAEQQLAPDLGAFARVSINDGTKEAYEFTEINRSVSGGLSLKGDRWSRSDDTIGVGGALNGISSDARRYFAAGGQGILIGDGQLPSYAGEKIIEAYYKAKLYEGISFTGDYQFIADPAYDAARGPIHFFAVRGHLEF